MKKRKIGHKMLQYGITALCISSLLFPMSVKAAEQKEKKNPEVYEEIDDILQQSVCDLHIPGMAVIIVDADEVLFSETYGNCDSIDTPFIIGSVSKSFTALSVMQLVEQGKIDLDMPISEYLDVSLYFKNASDGDKITVKQLLNQTSGLGEYQRFGNAEITDSYGTHQYANVNYGLLGKIVESVSGESYEEYVTAHIFEPLNMTHSAASLEKSKENGLIDGYRNYYGFPIAGEPDYPNDESWSIVPAGYLSASASDMGKYLQMYLNDGAGIISLEGMNSMFYDNVYVDDASPYYYGMGWTLTEQYSEPILNHSGLVENYTSNMFLLPERGIGVLFLINTNDFLVTNSFLDAVSGNVILRLLDEGGVEISSTAYIWIHVLLDIVYLAIIILAVIPLLRIRKWKMPLKTDKKPKKVLQIIRNGFLHLVLPTVLLCVPSMTGNPLWVVWYFVKDLFFVLVISAVLLYVGGIIKIGICWRADKSTEVREVR